MAILTTDFEEVIPFSDWTATQGAPTIVAAPVHHNAHACYMSNWNDRVYKTFAAMGEGWFRTYVRFASLPAVGNHANLFWLHNGDRDVTCALYNNGGNVFWELITREGWAQVSYVAASGPVVDTWYCAKIWFKKNTLAGSKLWIDSVQVAVSAGTAQNEDLTAAWLASSAQLKDHYFDCCVVDSADIACEAVGGKFLQRKKMGVGL